MNQIKIRLLAAHASLKCYTYTFLRRHHGEVPDECLALLPLFSKSSSILGKYWIGVLQDYCYIFLNVHLQKKWNSFLDGIQSPLASSKLQPCLEESWPVILQALALDAVPVNLDGNRDSETTVENLSVNSLLSGYSMVELESKEYQFLWGFSLLVLFREQHPTLSKLKSPLASAKYNHDGESPMEELSSPSINLYEVVLPVFQFLSTHRFSSVGFLTMDICRELLQVFSYCTCMDNMWDSLSVPVLSQIVQNCPAGFLETENFAYSAMEICMAYLFKVFSSNYATSLGHSNWEALISSLFTTAKTLVNHFEPKKQLISVALAFLLIGYKCIREASTDLCLSKVNEFAKSTSLLLKKFTDDKYYVGDDCILIMRTIFGTCLTSIANLSKDCIKSIHQLENRSDLRPLWQAKLAFSVEQTISFAKLVHEIECLRESDHDPVYFAMFKYCIECIQAILADSNIQVQAIGLQVLKGIVQRGTNVEDNKFLMFFAGELVENIFLIIQKMLKKPVTKQSAANAGECLRFLVLLQTVSKDGESQRAYVHLFLEAIVMFIVASGDDYSQELNDLKSSAIRLVSHIAQIPSSTVHFKDVLLSMPVTHRQQLQEVIRASVTQDQNASQVKPEAPSLGISSMGIRLPVPAMERKEKIIPPSDTALPSNKEGVEEDEGDEEDEDDWDAFQSFPASTNAAEEPPQSDNSSDSKVNEAGDDSQEKAISQPSNDTREDGGIDQEDVETEVVLDTPGDEISLEKSIPSASNEVEEPQSSLSELDDDQHHEREDTVELREETEQLPSDVNPSKEAEGLVGVDLLKDHELRDENSDDKIEQAPSDPIPLEKEEHLAETKTELIPLDEEEQEVVADQESKTEPVGEHRESIEGSKSPKTEDDGAKI